MTCSFAPFGGGSRVVSLWDMLQFYADKFVNVFNTLDLVEGRLGNPNDLMKDEVGLSYVDSQLQQLHDQLLGLNFAYPQKL